MHRRSLLCTTLAAVLLVAGAGPGWASDTGADACTGTGSATLDDGIGYPPFFTSSLGFTFTFNCIDGRTLSGSGTLESASCGRSFGTGTMDGAGEFQIETLGSMFVVVGAINGGGNTTAIPDTSTVPFGNSCSNQTASLFTIMGGRLCLDVNSGWLCPSPLELQAFE